MYTTGLLQKGTTCGGNEQLAYKNQGFPFKYVRFTVCLCLIRFINIIIYTGQRHSSVKKVVLLQWSCRECWNFEQNCGQANKFSMFLGFQYEFSITVEILQFGWNLLIEMYIGVMPFNANKRGQLARWLLQCIFTFYIANNPDVFSGCKLIKLG